MLSVHALNVPHAPKPCSPCERFTLCRARIETGLSACIVVIQSLSQAATSRLPDFQASWKDSIQLQTHRHRTRTDEDTDTDRHRQTPTHPHRNRTGFQGPLPASTPPAGPRSDNRGGSRARSPCTDHRRASREIGAKLERKFKGGSKGKGNGSG